MLREGEFGQLFRQELDPDLGLITSILTHDTKGDPLEDGTRPAVVELFWPKNSVDYTAALEKAVAVLRREPGMDVTVKTQKNTFIGDAALQSVRLPHDALRGLLSEIAPLVDYQEHVTGLQ